MDIRTMLHEKRMKTDAHIQELERARKAGKRYTAMMPDIPFLILALLCDIGWIIHLFAGVRLLTHQFHLLLFVSLVVLIEGVAMTVYLNLIHEKEIALGYQKDLSFGAIVLAGVLGFLSGVLLGNVWLIVGGLLNVGTGLPVYLSFQAGIHYGVQ